MQQKEVLLNDAGNRFEKYNGNASEVQLLSGADMPLTIIGAKAFLSCKSIEKLELPDTLERVEDWGFSHMKQLREIKMPAKEISFGKKVFLGCDKLQKVNLSKLFYEGIPYFLASMFRFFPEKNLENLEMAGDEQGQWEWLQCYDSALLAYSNRAHDYEFEPAFIGWFDVEDVDDQRQKYILEQRKHKIRLIFQRLLYDEQLSVRNRQLLARYVADESGLLEEMFGDKSEACSKDIRFYRIWKQIGGLDAACASRLLEKIGEEEPEIRGYLLQIQLGAVDSGDFFGELCL